MSDPQELDLGLPPNVATAPYGADLARVVGAVLSTVTGDQLGQVIDAVESVEDALTTPGGREYATAVKLDMYRKIKAAWEVGP